MPFAVTPGPGAAPFPAELDRALAAAVQARLSREPARTRHLHPDGAPRFTNRLALETSPYLLQHAHNPVDWRPWGAEALEEARRLARPVFLSVGYSTCHWCHVMEEESFEDEEIARLLNEKFVPVKVDREERPDVDAQYMQAVQLLTHQGGWPMSLFLLPDGQPIYGGTYFPARDGDRGGQVGFRTVLLELDRLWREERERLATSAAQLSALVRESLSPEPPEDLPGEESLRAALAGYASGFDAAEGGLRRAPKFPSSLPIRFLLRAARRFGDEHALRMAVLSLEKMALGGLFDQVGAGFHRYSTDARWLVPHFEKMLYDNALLVLAYVEAWQATAQPFFRRVARGVLDWMTREMSDPAGGFWSAQDADSLTSAGRREEGAFFAWTPAQLAEVLGEADGARAAALFGATAHGNFEGSNVLSLASVPSEGEQEFLDEVRPRLLAARAARPPPLTDRKVLAAWNGLAISAFARAGFAFGDDALVQRAARAAGFLLEVHRSDGVLLRASLEGRPRHAGLLEDHAFLAAGLVELFEATGESRWLAGAVSLHEALAERFADPAGGFFRTPRDGEALLGREKPAWDGAEPTGNSVAALTLLRLETLTGERRFGEQADGILRAFAGTLSRTPHALGELLLALDFRLGAPREIVLVRPPGGTDAELLDVLRPRFSPHDVRLRHEEGTAPATSLARDRPAAGARAAAYLCLRGACRLPVSTPAELAALL